MNCENCGAPMKRTLDDETYYCEFCSSTSPVAVSDDVIQVFQETCGLTCPICNVPLVTASILGGPASYCRNCGGVLVMQEIFLAVVDVLRSRAKGPGISPKPILPEQLQRRINCPHCGGTMDTHPYLGPGNFVIDICTACGTVWLDKGEVMAIALSPGGDREA